MSIEDLNELYINWCDYHDLTALSADEMPAAGEVLTDLEEKWLRSFVSLWDATADMEHVCREVDHSFDDYVGMMWLTSKEKVHTAKCRVCGTYRKCRLTGQDGDVIETYDRQGGI